MDGCIYTYTDDSERPDCLQGRAGSMAWAVGFSQAVATAPLSSQEGELPGTARPREHLRLLSQVSPSPRVGTHRVSPHLP